MIEYAWNTAGEGRFVSLRLTRLRASVAPKDAFVIREGVISACEWGLALDDGIGDALELHDERE